ncbi:MAG: hypothetical protein HC893_11505 [Chloroflexaceae bacterium]|nr:hypothetical protein [Chloroflexaceae bacterium]
MTTRTSFYRSVFKRRTTALVPTHHRTPAHLDRQRIRRIIVSDLHLSNGTRYEENLVGNTFSEFLSIYINHSEPIELVLAGDTFELLQVFPGGIDGTAWSEDLAVRRMQIVFAYHTTVLVSLRSFLAAPQHRLVILIGNHDFELHYHGVQLYIAAALGLAPGDERLCFATSYRGPGFALVHGNQFEPWDGFTYFAGITAPFEVVRGTQLVREVLNPIKLDPLEFAPLLEHTCPHTHFLQHLLSPAQRRNPVVWRYLNRTLCYSLRVLLPRPPRYVLDNPADAPTDPLITRPTFTRADWSRSFIELVAEAIQRIAGLPEFHDTAVFVCGHTHQAGSTPLGDERVYLNTGTWTPRIYDLPTMRREERRYPFVEISYPDHTDRPDARLLVWCGADAPPIPWEALTPQPLPVGL